MRDRTLSVLSRLICRWPWLFLLAGVLLAAGAAYLTVNFLGFKTSRNDLIGRDSEYWRLYSEYAKEFHAEEDYIIVVEGDQPTRNRDAVNALAKALLTPENNRDEAFPGSQRFVADDVFYRVDFDALKRRYLYFLDVKDLNEIRGSLKDFKQLLAILQQRPQLDTFFDAMNQMLQQMETAPEAQRRQMEAFLPTITAIVKQMGAPPTEEDASGLLSPWAGAFFSEEMLSEAEQQLKWKGYHAFRDGKMFIMLIHPRAESDAEATAPHAQTIEKMRRIMGSSL